MTVVWLTAAEAAERERVGGKAAAIAVLASLRMATPPGFVVTVQAMRDFLERGELNKHVSALPGYGSTEELTAALREVQAGIERAPWPKSPRSAIASAYAELGGVVAVRSSGVVEDSSVSSFAGAYSSFLHCDGLDNVLASVRRCWTSAFSQKVAAYRMEHHLLEANWTIAVIVQRMVVADKAGVMFTRNPYSQANTLLIEAVRGGCDQLVSGRPADISLEIDRIPPHAVLRVQRAPDPSRFGSGAVPLIGTLAPQPLSLLRKKEIDALVRTGLQLERVFRCPQDVEWAISGGRMELLQTRPLTSL